MKLTCILPTINRTTLKNSISSLIYQSNPNWNAIIIGDGCEPSGVADNRITYVTAPHFRNQGNVMNFAKRFLPDNLSSSDNWVMFLNDDDIFAENHVEMFYKYYEKYDFLCFRMYWYNKEMNKIPSDFGIEHQKLSLGNVGCCIAIKQDIFKIYDFLPVTVQSTWCYNDGHEDFALVSELSMRGFSYYMLPEVTYITRPKELWWNKKENVPIL